MGFGGMGGNSFGGRGGNSSFGSGVPGMGSVLGRNMPGLGGGQGAPGLNNSLGGVGQLGGGLGGVNAARLGGMANSGMGGPAAQSSYNPSGEILAMINKGQNLGMGLPQSHVMGHPAMQLPQALGQPGGQPGGMPGQGHGGLGLGMGGDLGMMNPAAFDMADFPSLGGRSTSFPPQFRPTPQAPAPVAPEFDVASEDFPALPASSGGGGGGGGGLGGGGLGGALGRGGLGGGLDAGMESVLGGMKDGLSHDDSGLGRGGGTGANGERADGYGLMGLLNVIRMTDQDLNTLALGTDLTTLGLNLNSSDCLYATFASPWADSPAQRDPEFTLPQCYYMQPPTLKTGHFSKFQVAHARRPAPSLALPLARSLLPTYPLSAR